jgi:hypothetical protein
MGGQLTERVGGRGQTLSPTSNNPDNDRRLSERRVKEVEGIVEWNDKEEPFIRKWIDYSNKYGIGYILTTDFCGVYFNDNSKMVMYPDN